MDYVSGMCELIEGLGTQVMSKTGYPVYFVREIRINVHARGDWTATLMFYARDEDHYVFDPESKTGLEMYIRTFPVVSINVNANGSVLVVDTAAQIEPISDMDEVEFLLFERAEKKRIEQEQNSECDEVAGGVKSS